MLSSCNCGGVLQRQRECCTDVARAVAEMLASESCCVDA
jgi:hypothetical protein